MTAFLGSETARRMTRVEDAWLASSAERLAERLAERRRQRRTHGNPADEGRATEGESR
ncbi:hypothetical protein [Nocardioides bruguierae]|uniref:hypothetical protein n=1 Tax=Nocardioides bruguierae TaxID=2945102 RepID=UPI0020207C8D|nr:hypothetical protein [Nocardioides bruguierae]MCL8024075.1 hypothetical protein [Nocardioides bruguierae]